MLLGTTNEFSETRLVLAIPSRFEKRLGKKLHVICHTYWQFDKQIKVIKFPHAKDKTFIATELRKQLELTHAEGMNVRTILTSSLKLESAALKKLKELSPSFQIAHEEDLIHGLLSAELSALGLTWQERVVNTLAGWINGSVTRESIDLWCNQFDRLANDSHRWVGESLLKGIKFYSTGQMSSSFWNASTSSSSGCTHSTLRYKIAGGADILSRLIQNTFSAKSGKQIKINNWFEVIANTDACHQACLVYEDGLFSGTEVADIIYTLAGQIKSAKDGIAPLQDPSQLKKLQSEFIFLVATDVGLSHFEAAIKMTGANIKITCCELVETLTDAGLTKLKQGCLYVEDKNGKQYIESTAGSLRLGVFEDTELFPTDVKFKAVTFCKYLCKTLFQTYLVKKNKTWSDELIDFCALGSSGMALAIVFAHSVPQSSLPVFWCNGRVKDRNGCEFDWVPLFPDARPT